MPRPAPPLVGGLEKAPSLAALRGPPGRGGGLLKASMPLAPPTPNPAGSSQQSAVRRVPGQAVVQGALFCQLGINLPASEMG